MLRVKGEKVGKDREKRRERMRKRNKIKRFIYKTYG